MLSTDLGDRSHFKASELTNNCEIKNRKESYESRLNKFNKQRSTQPSFADNPSDEKLLQGFLEKVSSLKIITPNLSALLDQGNSAVQSNLFVPERGSVPRGFNKNMPLDATTMFVGQVALA